jgi:hypothetical protein
MAAAEDAVQRLDGRVLLRYETAMNGFGIKLPSGASVQPLRTLAGLEYIAVERALLVICGIEPSVLSPN